MSSKKVPLVVYDEAGNRTVIGEAVVDIDGQNFDVTGVVTKKDYEGYLGREIKQLSLGGPFKGTIPKS